MIWVEVGEMEPGWVPWKQVERRDAGQDGDLRIVAVQPFRVQTRDGNSYLPRTASLKATSWWLA